MRRMAITGLRLAACAAILAVGAAATPATSAQQRHLSVASRVRAVLVDDAAASRPEPHYLASTACSGVRSLWPRLGRSQMEGSFSVRIVVLILRSALLSLQA